MYRDAKRRYINTLPSSFPFLSLLVLSLAGCVHEIHLGTFAQTVHVVLR